MTLTPLEAMRLAIEEAKKGAGFVAPNPLVGCVILDEKMRLLSTGYHKKFGGDHAEIEALKGVSDEQLEGAHFFVTLEPCAHEGKTPSCAKRLANLPIASVTYGLKDPNPLVNGQGAKILDEAGKQVIEFQELKSELEEVAEVFLTNIKKQQPFVALKVATSLDGQMGLKNGSSQWITSEASREHVQYLRGSADALLVGRGTIEIDNPRLNIRHPHFQNKKNKVVILDGDGQTLPQLKSKQVYLCHDPQNIFVIVKKGLKYTSHDYNIIECEQVTDGSFNLDMLLTELYRHKIYYLIVEGGSATFKSFFTQNKIQRIFHFQAPILLGSEGGLPWTRGLDIQNMKDRIQLKDVKGHFIGDNLLTTGRI